MSRRALRAGGLILHGYWNALQARQNGFTRNIDANTEPSRRIALHWNGNQRIAGIVSIHLEVMLVAAIANACSSRLAGPEYSVNFPVRSNSSVLGDSTPMTSFGFSISLTCACGGRLQWTKMSEEKQSVCVRPEAALMRKRMAAK